MANFPGMPPYLEAAARRRGVAPEVAQKLQTSWIVRQVEGAIAALTGLDDRPGDNTGPKQENVDRAFSLIEAQEACIEAQLAALREHASEHGLSVGPVEDALASRRDVSPEQRMAEQERETAHKLQEARAAVDKANAERQKARDELEQLQATIASATDLNHVPPPYAATGDSRRPKPFDRPAPTPPVAHATGENMGITPDPIAPSVPKRVLGPDGSIHLSPPQTEVERPEFEPHDPALLMNPNEPPGIAFNPHEQPDPENPIPAPLTLKPEVVGPTEGKPKQDPEAQAERDEEFNQGDPVGEIPPAPDQPEDPSDPSPPPAEKDDDERRAEIDREQVEKLKQAQADAEAKAAEREAKAKADARAKAEREAKAKADADKAKDSKGKK